MSPEWLRQIRWQTYRDLHRDIAASVNDAEDLLNQMMLQPDYREDIGAFIEKRAPNWGSQKPQLQQEVVVAEQETLSSPETIRTRLSIWIESVAVQQFITGLIVLNATTLGVQTAPELEARFGSMLLAIEWFVLGVFVIEILIKLYCFRLSFFRNGWNLMDFAIVGVSLVPASGPLAILRSLRILRVLRLLSTVPRLRQLTESLLMALPSIGWILFMLRLVFYIFGVLGTELFGAAFPAWFGTLGASIYSLFQIMTLESWSMGIARPVMAEFGWAWIYFVPFILISSFTILNLFVGIIVNSMQSMHWEEEEQKREESDAIALEEREEMLDLMRDISERLRRLEESAERHK